MSHRGSLDKERKVALTWEADWTSTVRGEHKMESRDWPRVLALLATSLCDHKQINFCDSVTLLAELRN